MKRNKLFHYRKELLLIETWCLYGVIREDMLDHVKAARVDAVEIGTGGYLGNEMLIGTGYPFRR